MNRETLNEKFFDAVVNLDKDYAAKLLEQGADVECYGNLALHQMVEDGHMDMVKFLIENNADVNSIRGGDSALYTAINYSQIEIASYLLDNGADAKAERSAALSIACQNQDFDIVKRMISLGADSFNDFSSNVIYSAMHSSESLKMIVNAYGESSVGERLQRALAESILNNNNTAAKALIEFGVDPTENNDNAFYQAVRADNKEIVNYLLLDRKMAISDHTREWLKGLSDTSILGAEAERYAYAEQSIIKRDLHEKLQVNLNTPKTKATKKQSFSLKI
ncbi:MAG: ankyrin repeat domain-containing protein [Herbaspirillum sp.]|uniref:ankyrin repeat domain-containing protein n=1 Tax=Herbaspirillum sp. TaxID=1890675 RepID=UPI002584BA2F|nr:ankyrin repeat domain-containing protein [Herbaspirillum sp.]MCP3658480.1 ankyrin repeat domain-containing protein [Herbaspirillum sp.]MCP3950084.1 ankyrin repeat domain-containing protein [Herbaspirillum sp.]MCP4033833.1 ankyrin repeat domain-containing protein [Herbaspirillum sp.]